MKEVQISVTVKTSSSAPRRVIARCGVLVPDYVSNGAAYDEMRTVLKELIYEDPDTSPLHEDDIPF